MNIEWVRRHCMAQPHATEHLQWGGLVFKIAGKVFAVLALEPAKVWLSCKCDPDQFADLVERPGIVQAPYFARNQWVALETQEALTTAEVKHLVTNSYNLVLQKLSKKARTALG